MRHLFVALGGLVLFTSVVACNRHPTASSSVQMMGPLTEGEFSSLAKMTDEQIPLEKTLLERGAFVEDACKGYDSLVMSFATGSSFQQVQAYEELFRQAGGACPLSSSLIFDRMRGDVALSMAATQEFYEQSRGTDAARSFCHAAEASEEITTPGIVRLLREWELIPEGYSSEKAVELGLALLIAGCPTLLPNLLG